MFATFERLFHAFECAFKAFERKNHRASLTFSTYNRDILYSDRDLFYHHVSSLLSAVFSRQTRFFLLHSS